MRSLISFALLSGAQAHTLFTTLLINDVSQGDGTCVRQSADISHSVSPVIDYRSSDIVCGVGGTKAVAYTCPAPAGAKLTFEYRMSPNTPGSGFIDSSHKGPCAVYAKQLSADTDSGEGDGWFKIWSEGYDQDEDLWCTEKLIKDDGFFSIDIPSALPAGNYLFRPEVVAMHNVTPEVEPQFYVGCAQVFVESDITGTLEVADEYRVSIPGYIQPGDGGVTYNIYNDDEYANPKLPYPELGPKAWVPEVSTLTTLSVSSSNEVTTQSEGSVPATCLLKNANWCGVEVAAYTDQEGCWNAVTDCWAQNEVCWNEAPPSGGSNCEVWETKCQDLDDQCSAGNFQGPPKFTLVSADAKAPAVVAAAMNAAHGEAPAATTGEASAAVTSYVADKPETTSSTAAVTTSQAAKSEPTTINAGPSTTFVTVYASSASTPSHSANAGESSSSAKPVPTGERGGRRHGKHRYQCGSSAAKK
ncbi:hypothetical protein JX265_004675 [Neoarthrinium moseri]|uniref:lytic cellulose monooxygenase (C4-dehydrogenating) n=1 Tax=Neoarthrinium moseri TaxID=1658444 RepID=A0A9Q0AQQ4_9PEZI|nr:uncharacterized protein JN550_003823 [Neoarthrinium moseri]KAI1872949.1 hypothetical protein JN550_003823 [Neoarthrinium moseri]KAI1874467.1 hypothetical protein JX265_004675 [Neoarthrinium moseri]